MSKQRLTYQQRAERLAKAIDIAVKIVQESEHFNDDLKQPMIDFCQQIKQLALHPELAFKKVASIKHLERDFLTYWNESTGRAVDKFWLELHKNGLDFEKRDSIQAVLKRGRIANIYEYDSIVDNILVAEQIGRINEEQAIELNRLIGDYENRHNPPTTKEEDKIG
ncbi:MAG: hypothetical protein AAFV95_04800 [Bacteroidota bacterium]